MTSVGRWATTSTARGGAWSSAATPVGSGDMLVSALAAGLTSVGTDVVDIGVVPTPGLAYVAEHGDHVAGVMVLRLPQPAGRQRAQGRLRRPKDG